MNVPWEVTHVPSSYLCYTLEPTCPAGCTLGHCGRRDADTNGGGFELLVVKFLE